MKLTAALFPVALMFAACEGTTDDTEADTEEAIPNDSALVGDWISEGANISPLFQTATFDYVEITAAFEADGTYQVDAVNGGGTTTTFTGTFTTDDSTDPATITLIQTVPSDATSEGIWQVDGTDLTYEVVQTSPDFGFVPPTPATGFGSTSGPNIEPDVNIQLYVAQ